MGKLYFKYGAMGSSKSAQVLITKYNYEEKGMSVWLLKSAIDNRDGDDIIKSRIGLQSKADIIYPDDNIFEMKKSHENINVIIVDECQFLSEKQINQLKEISIVYDISVLCFGLKTDFQTKLFPGSKRLFEIADSIQEIKTICSCGSKADVNARLDAFGNVITEGSQIQIGGNESYESMCYSCWLKRINKRIGE